MQRLFGGLSHGAVRGNVAHAAKNLLGRGLVVLHGARPWAPGGRVELVAVLAEVFQPAFILVGEHLVLQWLHVSFILGRYSDLFYDGCDVLFVIHTLIRNVGVRLVGF